LRIGAVATKHDIIAVLVTRSRAGKPYYLSHRRICRGPASPKLQSSRLESSCKRNQSNPRPRVTLWPVSGGFMVPYSERVVTLSVVILGTTFISY